MAAGFAPNTVVLSTPAHTAMVASVPIGTPIIFITYASSLWSLERASA